MMQRFLERRDMEDLDIALERLGMLNSVTNARREFINEMRLRGVRSQTSFPWRKDSSSEDSQDDWYSLPIKENLGVEKVMVYGGSKLLSRRCRSKLCRSFPYDINRKKPNPNTLISPMMSRMVDPSSTPTLPLVLQQQHSLPIYDALNKNRKTDKFPVPLLSRSKSLEDLRESPNKSKANRFQLLHCDDSSDGSCNGSNSIESPLSLSPRNSFFNVLKGEVSIKQEIDSMSMRIEKLDVT
ncbi:hypothetical protein Ocin01_15158 [Orchesella cincta]|uniref:Uncharacterized protein n=1 Tax=Orchesella cincta TaxID=48709 RepID=A0A1D2MET6_ORCCI|nr:hypothetical protein Ocin01_15158 [Orchesella cincta]